MSTAPQDKVDVRIKPNANGTRELAIIVPEQIYQQLEIHLKRKGFNWGELMQIGIKLLLIALKLDELPDRRLMEETTIPAEKDGEEPTLRYREVTLLG